MTVTSAEKAKKRDATLMEVVSEHAATMKRDRKLTATILNVYINSDEYRREAIRSAWIHGACERLGHAGIDTVKRSRLNLEQKYMLQRAQTDFNNAIARVYRKRYVPPSTLSKQLRDAMDKAGWGD